MTHRPLTVAALLLVMFMGAIEATVVSTAMPTVVSELGGLSLYGWVGSSYLIASTVSVPIYGKLADLYGRKPILLFAVVLFLIGSVLCGVAGSIGALVAWRVVQGLGAGGMQPIALTVVGDLFTIEQRGRIQGLFGAVWAIAGIAGPLLGGLLVRTVSWRAVFLVNVPIGVASMLALVAAYHEKHGRAARVTIDWAGALVLALAAVSLLAAASGRWSAAILAVALLVLFVAIERAAEDPVLSLSLVARRPIAVASLSGALLGAAMMGVILYVPLYVQAVLGRTPTQAGATIAPMLVGWPIASTITGRLLTRIGFRAPVWLGSAVVVGALTAIVLLLTASTSLLGVQVAMFVYGLGMGLSVTAQIVAIQTSVGLRQRGVVTATNLFSRNMGGALGVGALGGLLAHRLGASMPPEKVAALLDPTRRASVLGVTATHGTLDALGQSLRPLFWATAAVGLVNLVVIAFWPKRIAPADEARAVDLPR